MIKAYIVLEEGESCDRAEIVAWCRERLASYKVPRMVEFRAELPRTLVGKVLRRVLRAEEEEKKRKERGKCGAPFEDLDPGFDNTQAEESAVFSDSPYPGNASGISPEEQVDESSLQSPGAVKSDVGKSA